MGAANVQQTHEACAWVGGGRSRVAATPVWNLQMCVTTARDTPSRYCALTRSLRYLAMSLADKVFTESASNTATLCRGWSQQTQGCDGMG